MIVEDCFEGITYCDYSAETLLPKPRPEMYEKAEREANATSADRCYFIGLFSPLRGPFI
jgi:pyrimidine and pyridine-specific 5'-nucleotidase